MQSTNAHSCSVLVVFPNIKSSQSPLSHHSLPSLILIPPCRYVIVILSCLFGVRPALPSLEKEFVTELMLRSQAQCPQTRERPHGPPGSQWCVHTAIQPRYLTLM